MNTNVMTTSTRDLAKIAAALGHQRQLLVAFSGGLDSTVLLHQLLCVKETLLPDLRLRAIHVHHGLSPRADAWVAHCQSLCQDWQIPLHVARVHLPSGGQGLEAEARKARYQAIAAELREGEVVVTAQHQDDQCETLLLALKRGSGPAGLAAMPRILNFAETLLLRPLLATSRADLETWATTYGLVWIEDESNQQDRYDRNFLRLRVLPIIHQRWPHFTQSVSRSAALCGEQEQLLDELLAEQLAALIADDGSLAIAPLIGVSEARRGALLRRWLTIHQARMPSRDTLLRLWTEVALSRVDANPRLQIGAHQVRRYQERLYWVKEANIDKAVIFPWNEPYHPLTIANIGQIALADIGTEVRPPDADETVSIRFQASGTLHIVGRDKGRSLKKIWQELNIAPWQRERTPLLFYGEKLICAPGIFVTREGQPQEGASWFVRWQAEER